MSGRRWATAWAWLWWGGPPVALMVLIFSLGGSQASNPETRSLLLRLLATYLPALYSHLSPAALDTLNVVSRKGGHFVGYALLGAMDARFLRWRTGRVAPAVAFLACVLAAGWAVMDEFHQSFSPSRSASAEDVLLDACGALAGILLYALCLRWRARRS